MAELAAADFVVKALRSEAVHQSGRARVEPLSSQRFLNSTWDSEGIYRLVQKKGTVLLSFSLAWPAVDGCSQAETVSQLCAISFAQPSQGEASGREPTVR